MEKNEISVHEVRFFLAVIDQEGWFTSAEIAQSSKIAKRTGRAFCNKWVKLGLLDQADVFPSHRYRFSTHAKKRNAAYLLRVENAANVFGLSCVEKVGVTR